MSKKEGHLFSDEFLEQLAKEINEQYGGPEFNKSDEEPDIETEEMI
ncbi:bacitracin ABC transporter ATP-binding protein [Fictibacillus sp. WQ 8-8]|uniref:Bacitracin ABC transporter ATP-binding protein n=1 Tax=Fictibacillus marinisediminis TaxID=2878389 RepID=A0A9X2BC05_9BACL|nr:MULTISPECIES: hypothetical protein [Fictibacillus]SFE80417.1 hypothetical protein SAMN05428981_108188 [Bacillus sp. OV194]MCK6256404.1 bacitracin ABC transporter ATP-binding protein [Fictibacillus marinisediminis]MCQ6265191.1 bacitracin ABC transporter ATP-binding protein [Fictibacillus sp. WQ 8-8]MED2971877.1 bacitracin ABC transporter ATP-binding protein [Fictibacillus sp. B-59209]UZJ77705.1 bacitracin ABC transporter ATP-binding protein [Fictibacillus sp. KU28468]